MWENFQFLEVKDKNRSDIFWVRPQVCPHFTLQRNIPLRAEEKISSLLRDFSLPWLKFYKYFQLLQAFFQHWTFNLRDSLSSRNFAKRVRTCRARVMQRPETTRGPRVTRSPVCHPPHPRTIVWDIHKRCNDVGMSREKFLQFLRL